MPIVSTARWQGEDRNSISRSRSWSEQAFLVPGADLYVNHSVGKGVGLYIRIISRDRHLCACHSQKISESSATKFYRLRYIIVLLGRDACRNLTLNFTHESRCSAGCDTTLSFIVVTVQRVWHRISCKRHKTRPTDAQHYSPWPW